MVFPGRYIHLDAARARLGDRVDRFGRFFSVGDPLADAAVASLSPFARPTREAMIDGLLAHGADSALVPDAPEALRAVIRHAEHVPFWLDLARAARGGSVLLRAGPFGGIVLGSYALAASYCSPAGNKPLMFSGRLTDETPRRLAETARFVLTVCSPGGMQLRAPGWIASVRVRLVHASIRQMLSRSDRWNTPAWGIPINQADMSGTVLLFSLVVLEGLSKLTYPLTPSDREDSLHLWRYVGYLQGVDPELLCSTVSEARDLWDLLSSTQAPPDDDSRVLAQALLESALQSAHTPQEIRRARRIVAFGYAVSRHLLGDAYADGLGYPRTPWRFALPALMAAAHRAGGLLQRLPGGRDFAQRTGVAYWNRAVRQGLGHAVVAYTIPDALGRSPTLLSRDDRSSR